MPTPASSPPVSPIGPAPTPIDLHVWTSGPAAYQPARGMDPAEAAENARQMADPYRIPDILAAVNRETKAE